MKIGRFSFHADRDQDAGPCPVCGQPKHQGLEARYRPCWWGWSLGLSWTWVCHNCHADGGLWSIGISYNNAKGMRWQEDVIQPRLKAAKEAKRP